MGGYRGGLEDFYSSLRIKLSVPFPVHSSFIDLLAFTGRISLDLSLVDRIQFLDTNL